MDKRFKEISLLISEYSVGKFDNTLHLSPKLDEVDAIASGVNMLGEELRAITISRNYFTNIFNSVSDMVFIVNNKGVIEDANVSAEIQLQYTVGTLAGKNINDLYRGRPSFLKNITKALKTGNPLIPGDSMLYTLGGAAVPVSITATHLKDERKKQPVILVTASDITYQKKAQNLVVRAIIDTQEKERRRLAQDLHDSLTQQLSAIKFYISSIADSVKNQQQQTILLKSNEALTNVITDMRNICFNLSPKSLDEFPLVKSVQDFCNHFLYHKKTRFVVEQHTRLPELPRELKVDLYRVIQEFIANAINHGAAGEIGIFFSCHKKILTVVLKDNGKGFDVLQQGNGMGLQNVRSRIKSHNGELTITSSAEYGTQYKIIIPLIHS